MPGFSNYSHPRFLHGGGLVQDLLLGRTESNSFLPNSRAERTQRGVQGPAQGSLVSLVGSRGNAPRGPGVRAPRSSWVFRVFKTPKRLSSHNFLSFSRQVLLQNQLTMLIYDMR